MARDDAPTDRKTETTAGLPLRARLVDLDELVEHDFELVRGDAHALVAHAENGFLGSPLQLPATPSSPAAKT